MLTLGVARGRGVRGSGFARSRYGGPAAEGERDDSERAEVDSQHRGRNEYRLTKARLLPC